MTEEQLNKEAEDIGGYRLTNQRLQRGSEDEAKDAGQDNP